MYGLNLERRISDKTTIFSLSLIYVLLISQPKGQQQSQKQYNNNNNNSNLAEVFILIHVIRHYNHQLQGRQNEKHCFGEEDVFIFICLFVCSFISCLALLGYIKFV